MLFKSNVVLSVVDGRLFCKLDEIYKLLSYMVGWSVMTHELPHLIELCKPHLTMELPTPPEDGLREWCNGVFDDVEVPTLAEIRDEK